MPVQWKPEELATLCAERVQILAPELISPRTGQSESLVRQITALIEHNLLTKRAERVLAMNAQADPSDAVIWYVDRVIACFVRERTRIERLAEGDSAEWKQLHEQLTRRAFAALGKWGMSYAEALLLAQEAAQETCILIWQKRFPFDVEFDLWAMLILHNHLVTKLTRSLDALDAAPEIVSLDPTPNGVSAAPSLAELLSDPASARAFESIAVQDWLMQAVDHLPKSQAQFIRDFYFSDMDYATIARRLGKTVTEVYLLKFRALTNLKKILQKEKISPAKALKRVEGHD